MQKENKNVKDFMIKELYQYNLSEKQMRKLLTNNSFYLYFNFHLDKEIHEEILKANVDVLTYSNNKKPFDKDEYFEKIQEDMLLNIKLDEKLKEQTKQLAILIDLYKDTYFYNHYDEDVNYEDIEKFYNDFPSLNGIEINHFPLLADHNNIVKNMKLFESFGCDLPSFEFLIKPNEELLAIALYLDKIDKDALYNRFEEKIVDMYENSGTYFIQTDNPTLTNEFLEAHGINRDKKLVYKSSTKIEKQENKMKILRH